MHGMELAANSQVRYMSRDTMTGQFSSNAEATIERKLDSDIEKRNSTEDISSYYELSRASEWIKQGRFKKVDKNFINALKSFP